MGIRDKVADRVASGASSRVDRLEARIGQLEDAVDESRRLNRRLSDVIDIVTELLLPAVDRSDARIAAALERLERTLGDPPTT